MERPYGISDFALPNQWDRESRPATWSIPYEQKSQTVDSASLVPGFK